MSAEPPNPIRAPTSDTFVMRQSALDAIKHAPTPGDAKRRILLARELGLLDDAETEEWIAIFGVAGA